MSKKQKPQLTKIEGDIPGIFKNIDEATDIKRYAHFVEATPPQTYSEREPTHSLNGDLKQNESDETVPIDQPSAKEKSEQDPIPCSDVKSDISEKSLWNDFMLFAEESRKAIKKKEAQVWINEDLKIIMERIRCAGVRLPIKHLMNGILKAFITANQKDIEKLLRQKIKL